MAARVGIISDTHGMLRQEVLDILDDCDYILHAGDITSEEILDPLRSRGRIYVVRGNNDGLWASGIARTQSFQIEGLRFFMVHDQMDAGPEALKADVIIFGHSHRYSQQVIDGRLWLNPGSCGRARFGGDVTMAVMDIDDRKYHVEKIMIRGGAF